MATATKSPIAELQAAGVSVWLDNISRGILKNGHLKELIDEDGLQGVTSNPTIFEKAIGHTPDYDEDIKKTVGKGGTSTRSIRPSRSTTSRPRSTSSDRSTTASTARTGM